MARWQRWNPAVLQAIREGLGWSAEEFAQRLRIWQLVDWLNLDVFPGAGVVALRTYLDQDTLEGVDPGKLAGLEAFLTTALKERSKTARGGGLAAASIRRWENGDHIPGVPQLHVICDTLDLDAGDLFAPSHPGRPKADPAKSRSLAAALEPLAEKMREAHPPQPRRKPGRPRKVRESTTTRR